MKRITTLIIALTLAIIFLLTDEALSLKILCNNAPAPAGPVKYHNMQVAPLFRYHVSGDHFYTANWNELKGCNFERVIGYVFAAKQPGTVALHRLYARTPVGNHLYSVRPTEVNSLSARPEWKYEGITGYVYTSAQPGSVPLHRLYHTRPNHLYSTRQTEVDILRKRPGWKYERVIGHVIKK